MSTSSLWRMMPLLAPTQLLLISVIVIPSIYVIWLSLNASTYGQSTTFVGFDNYVRVLSDPGFHTALRNTVLLVVVAVHLELLMALGMALLFNSGLWGRRFLLVAVLAPYAVSEVVAVAMWRFLFDQDVGPVTLLLNTLGLPALEWSYEPSHAMIMIAVLTIWMHLPFTFVILYAARLALPADLYEAAGIDGATRLQSFRRVTIPLMGPAILVALLFRYIFAFRMFSEVWLLTGGGPARTTEVVAVYLYQEAFTYSAFGPASATAWIMVAVSMVLASGYILLLRKQVKKMRLERFLVIAGKTLAVVLILLWSLFPIFFIVTSSFKPGREIFAVPPHWLFAPTFDHFVTLWQSWRTFFEALLNSTIVTIGATSIAVIASTCAGYVYSRSSSRFLELSLVFLIVVRLIPPIVVTLPLFPIVNYLGLADTHFVLSVLYATFFVSLGTVLMRTFIDQIPRELDEAASMDGATIPVILWKVIMPLAAPGILAVAVFVVVFAWNEFLFAFIFTSTRAKTAPLVISEMIGSIEGVDWGVLFAASTVQLLPVLLFVMAMNRYLVAGLTSGATKG